MGHICVKAFEVMRTEVLLNLLAFMVLSLSLAKGSVFRDPGIYLNLDYSKMLVDQHGPKVFKSRDFRNTPKVSARGPIVTVSPAGHLYFMRGRMSPIDIFPKNFGPKRFDLGRRTNSGLEMHALTRLQ